MYDDDDDDDDNAAPLGGCGEGTCKPIVASCCIGQLSDNIDVVWLNLINVCVCWTVIYVLDYRYGE